MEYSHAASALSTVSPRHRRSYLGSRLALEQGNGLHKVWINVNVALYNIWLPTDPSSCSETNADWFVVVYTAGQC